ncbi:hypothetical protein EDI_111460 [Entamoeba dispar SAW760]|uniref:Uncharacterized protein n=1 Tax=Entamoeba dispar (strain ATCC PRA-260 / SAW760) TaxID=370354 RepID=B0EGP2_ENTDS|nr:uncharacterized protein EDI_111460 [Entamoeba dispar SAW760]EDR26316.1 hypothetical protein EDI_111460 [Entamoeba dispar SAW760]|eukprot:EDR26316.1 hypothetical protein EDI_111460 [Entamoeba dispar SAW760]
MCDKSSIHVPINLMDRIKYKLEIPVMWNEDSNTHEDEIFFEEEDKLITKTKEQENKKDVKKKGIIKYSRKTKVEDKEEEKKPTNISKKLLLSSKLKKKEFIAADEEIRQQIEYVVTELEKRQTEENPIVDGIITNSKKLNENEVLPNTDLKKDVLDLRTANNTITFVSNEIPPILMKQNTPKNKIQLRTTQNKYHFPGTECGFDTIKEYKLMKLNADKKELKTIKILINELDKTIESCNEEEYK